MESQLSPQPLPTEPESGHRALKDPLPHPRVVGSGWSCYMGKGMLLSPYVHSFR